MTHFFVNTSRMGAWVRNMELRVLLEISCIIGETLNLSQSLERVLGIMSGTLAMKRATVTLRDPRSVGLPILCLPRPRRGKNEGRGVQPMAGASPAAAYLRPPTPFMFRM